jgi:hypothetical protein
MLTISSPLSRSCVTPHAPLMHYMYACESLDPLSGSAAVCRCICPMSFLLCLNPLQLCTRSAHSSTRTDMESCCGEGGRSRTAVNSYEPMDRLFRSGKVISRKAGHGWQRLNWRRLQRLGMDAGLRSGSVAGGGKDCMPDSCV